jgi:hypothetical protein
LVNIKRNLIFTKHKLFLICLKCAQSATFTLNFEILGIIFSCMSSDV